MFHPFYDLATLSNEELDEKIKKLYQIMIKQPSEDYSQSNMGLIQLRDALEAEKERRASDTMIKAAMENNEPINFGEVVDELGVKYDK